MGVFEDIKLWYGKFNLSHEWNWKQERAVVDEASGVVEKKPQNQILNRSSCVLVVVYNERQKGLWVGGWLLWLYEARPSETRNESSHIIMGTMTISIQA